MTLEAGRIAIETYFIAQWADRLPYRLSDEPFTPQIDFAVLTIREGARLQGSIGRALNRIDNIGTVTVSIYTDAEKASAEWRGHAQAVLDIFHGVTLGQDGVPISATADAFVRFSPTSASGRDQQHPYVSASNKQAPYQITNVIAPFIRYSFK